MPGFKVQPSIRGSKPVVLGGEARRANILLGRLSEFGPQRDVLFDLDREHVVAVVGKRGSGKTHTLGVLVEGLSLSTQPGVQGDAPNSSRHAVIIFDTLNLFQWIDIPLANAHGATAEKQRELLRRWKLDAAAIEPTFWHPVGSEPATDKSTPFSINPSDLDAQDWGRLLGLDIATEPMGQLLNELYALARDNRRRTGTAQQNAIDKMLEALRSDPHIQADYSPETVRGVRQRLAALSRSPLFEAGRPDWTAALAPGRVAVFLLGRVPEDERSVLVFLIIRRLLEARAAASEQVKHSMLKGEETPSATVPPAWLVIDEAQNILPSRNVTAANDILTRFVREGRNFGLSLAVTTQQPSSIDPRVMAQVDTLIAHTLTVRADLNYVLSNLKSAEPVSIQINSRETSLADSLRLLEQGQCMISSADSDRLIYCEIRPRVTLHGGFEA
jgi:uncharacterized protein